MINYLFCLGPFLFPSLVRGTMYVCMYVAAMSWKVFLLGASTAEAV